MKKPLIKSKKEVKEEAEVPNYNAGMQAAFGKALDRIEKKRGLGSGSGIQHYERLSTGNLSTDLVLGGGLLPGLNSISGKEASGKSTFTNHTTASAIKSHVPHVGNWDCEGTHFEPLQTTIFKPYGISYVKSMRNKIIRYEDDESLEVFFGAMSDLLKTMPRKIWLNDANTWALAFPKGASKEAKLLQSFMNDAGMVADKKLSAENPNNWIVPIEYNGIQAFQVLDSWPVLLPDKMDEDDDPNSGLAAQARAFSDQLKRIGGKFRSRGMVLLGVNQIRLAPMKVPPEYEPGGEALKLYSSQRSQTASLVPPQGWLRDPSNYQVQIEDSVENPKMQDKYQWKRFKNIKNKFSTPYLQTWIRVWVSDHTGKGRGIDPVFDTYNYLKNTGQVIGNPNSSKGFTLKFIDVTMKMTWTQFKLLILAEVTKSPELLKQLTFWKGKPNLRERCFKQIKSGEAQKLMVNNDSEEDSE